MSRAKARAGAAAIVVLLAAGMILAMSWEVAFPSAVLAAAWVVALVAIAVVFVDAVRSSRREGVGVLRTLGRSFREVGRFILWFF